MSEWRRTSWQQVIVAQASFLEYECKRAGLTDKTALSRPNAGRQSLVLKRAAPPANSR